MIILTIILEDARDFIVAHWQIMLFIIFAAMFVLGGAPKLIRYIIRKAFEAELQPIHKKITEMNDKTNAVLNDFSNRSLIHHAIILSNISTQCSNDDEVSVNNLANILFYHYHNNGIIIPNWKKYGLPDNLIDKMQELYLEEELKKLKANKKVSEKI